jgi:GPI mannosyltransferase 3
MLIYIKFYWSALLVLGLLLRVVSCYGSMGIVQPDENQVYMEVAQGIVYGHYHHQWEYDRGIRHYLFPGFIAGLLYALDFVGVKHPVAQASTIRFIIATSVFLAMALLSRRLMLQGRNYAGFLLIVLAATNPDFIFISNRTLSETAVMLPLALSMVLLPCCPGSAGALLGLGFAVRNHIAFYIAAIWLATLVDDLRHPPAGWLQRRLVRFSLGLFLGGLVIGAIDYATWGTFFFSAIQNFKVQIFEGVASTFGVSPWYEYLAYSSRMMVLNSPFYPFLLIIGAVRDRRQGFALFVFVLGHSIISHKEFRFIWPVLPLVFLLIAEGFEAVCCFLRPRPRAAFVGLFALSVAVGTGWRAWRTPWNLEPSRSSMVAMATVGTEPDLRGVALFGVPTAFSGNRFYLRRDVPFLVAETPDVELFLNDPNWKSGNINYLVTYKDYENLFSMYNPRIMKRCEKLIIYKIDSAPGMRERS